MLGHIVIGGAVIDHGGLASVPWVAALVPLAALGVAVAAMRFERGRAPVPAAAE